MKYRIIIIFILFINQLNGQSSTDKLIGEWKLYLSDNISFEYLKLNPDGTGLKCFGQTLNNKDSFFLNHVTTLHITKWIALKNKLFFNSENTVSYELNPEYTVNFIDNNKISLTGEHLIFSRYPSILNKKAFQRTVIYEHAETIIKDKGTTTASCIGGDRDLLTFKSNDSTTQIAAYKGFEDLIPHLVSCNNGFEFAQKYYDKPYFLEVPAFITNWSLGFGNKEFYISLNCDESDTTKTHILIYYDFDDNLKNFFFNQLKKGAEKENIINYHNFKIYKTKYTSDNFEGRLFLENSIIIMYYTKDKSLEKRLQQSLISFKYK